MTFTVQGFLGPDMLPAVLVAGMRDEIYSLSSLLCAKEHTGSPGKVAIFTESGAVILESDSCQELLQQAIHQGSQTHVDGIYVLRPASMTTMAHVHSSSTAHANQEDTSGLYAGYTRPGLHRLPGLPCTTDRTRLETVYSDGTIPPETNYRPMVSHTMCSHMTRNNVSYNIDVPSPARIYTTYEMHSASQVRLLSAVTVRPKSLYEDWPSRIHRYAVASEDHRSQLHRQGRCIS